jgi:hypothetical protein
VENRNVFANRSLQWQIAASVACLLCAITFLLAAYPALKASWYGVSQFQDDSFYYLVTAKNFVNRGMLAFDGINTTNGFQPVWMGALIALFKALGPNSTLEIQIFAVNALEKFLLGLAVAVSVGLYIRSQRRNLPWAAGYLALTLLLLCPFYVIFEQGMETTLAVLLLLLVIYAFLSDRFLLLGLTLAALFLTRLDTAVFVAAPFLLWTLVKASRKTSLLAITVFTVPFLTYVGINIVTTGHLVPISGALKSSFPIIRWQGAFFTEPITLARMFGWLSLVRGINIVECSALVLGGLGLMVVARPSTEVRGKLLMLAAIAALLVSNLLMFQKWDKSIDPRYLAMPMTVATIFFANSFAFACERARSWVENRATAATRATAETRAVWLSPGIRTVLSVSTALPFALICVLLLAEANVHLSRFRTYVDRKEDPIRQIYLEVSRVLPPNAVVAGTDVGALAFWTQRRVINLDGVINNFEYQEYLRSGALREYLRRQGVTHLATALWDREQAYTGRPIEPMYRQVLDPPAVHGVDYKQHEFFVYSYLYGVYSDKITLTPRDEVYRKFLGKDGVADAAYVVYRLPG